MARLLDMAGMVEYDAPPRATMQIHVERPADRLRVRKGQVVRWTSGDTVQDFVVERVGYPDQFGRCDVDLTPAR